MDWLPVTYRIKANKDEIQARAEAIAIEQSVELPVQAIRDRYVLEQVVARVDSIKPVDPQHFDVVIRLSAETIGHNPAQLLNMLFGNVSLHHDVQLIDVELPQTLLTTFSGPRYGVAGLRDCVQVYQRPLTCTALKPQGLSVAELTRLCGIFATAGIDIIKDDHGMADQAYARFADRVQACQRAVEKANRDSGRTAVYAPSLVGNPQALYEQIRIVKEEGVKLVLIAPMLIGLPVFRELVHSRLHIPVLAHPAFAGAGRIAPEFLLGKLFRWFGADAVIYPNYGGRFSYNKEQCAAIAHQARMKWHNLRPTMPVPAGGMTVDRVDELLRFYGREVILLIGGGLLSAGDELAAKCREFVAQVARAESEEQMNEF